MFTGRQVGQSFRSGRVTGVRRGRHQPARNFGAELRLALGSVFYRPHQVVAAGVFEQVARRPRPHRVEQPVVPGVGRQHQHGYAGESLSDTAGSLHPV